MNLPALLDALRVLHAHTSITPQSMTLPAVAWDALAMEAAESATHALVSHSFGNAPEILLVTDHGEVRLVRGC